MMERRVLAFPASMSDALFGTDEQEPTIPAPEGGWGVPAVSEDGSTLVFGVPAEHITTELRDHIEKSAQRSKVEGKLDAREVTYDEWETKLAFVQRSDVDVKDVEGDVPTEVKR